jgi:hypothetical protein
MLADIPARLDNDCVTAYQATATGAAKDISIWRAHVASEREIVVEAVRVTCIAVRRAAVTCS